jgi:type IV pilus assembly protein PilO
MTKKMQQNIIFMALIAFGMFYIYSKLLIGPLDKQYKIAQDSLAQSEQKLTDMKRRALELPRLQAEMAYLEDEVKDLEKLLPKDKDVPQLIRMITKTAQHYKIDIKTIAPATMNQMPNYTEYPFHISMQCSYSSLAHFFSELAQDERILNFRDVNFSGQAPTKEDPDTISVTFTLVAFTFKG